MSSALQKSVRNQLAFREVNERIVELTGPWNDRGVGLFKCECSDPACAKSLEITTAEYEQVRADGARFVVLHGHEQPELEHIVDSCTRFLVIEKVGPTRRPRAQPIHAATPDARTPLSEPLLERLSQLRLRLRRSPPSPVW